MKMILKSTYQKDLFQVNKEVATESSEQVPLMRISFPLSKLVQSISNCNYKTLLNDFSCRFIVMFCD